MPTNFLKVKNNMTDNATKTITIKFANPISQKELPFLRGAIINVLGKDAILGHNHMGEDLRYSYPLLQYKNINGNAAIVGINDGVELAERFLEANPKEIHIGKRTEQLLIANICKEETHLSITPEMRCYAIKKYLPLNKENYEEYKRSYGLLERCSLLERCLVGNILSFAKGIGIFFDDHIRVSLQDIGDEHLYNFKTIKMMGFDIVFKTNVLLPRFIGLGKKVSFGFGTITPINESKNQKG